LEELKITKDRFISKDTKTINKINEQLMIIICQPDHDIFGKVMEFYYILNKTDFYFIFIPCETYGIINFLNNPGIGHRYTVTNFNIDLIPIDNDLISMEKTGNFKEIYVDKNITPISDFVESFIKLEMTFGKIKHKYIKGEKAKLFNDLLEKKESETNLKITDEILGMIVLDRSIDFLTPFTSNYTYEGLFDDHFGINKGSTIFENTYLNINENKKESKKNVMYYLTTDYASKLFNEIRCMNYLDANKYMYELQDYYKNETERLNSKDLSKVQKVMEKLKEYATFYKNPIIINRKFMTKFIDENHKEENMIYRTKESIFLSGTVPNNLKLFYDDYIADKKDLYNLLNLFILETLTQGCVKDYNILKRDILNVYGYQNIFLFRDLETIGLIKEKADAIGLIKERVNLKNKMELNYQQIVSKLNLISPDANDKNSKYKDCSYIYQGYCPIILRLIELAVQGKWGKNKEVITKMSGETLFPEDESEIIKPPKNDKSVHTIFVVFVGGVSYNEIAGIRFINRQLKLMYDKIKDKDKNATRVQLIIVTNEILNKKKIFKSLGEEFKQKCSFKEWNKELEKDDKKKK
jgi:lysine-specific histone demethylase 1